ncbi:dihydrofolate reductase [Agromyces flavus]|uniref:Dihydrofolate reductase n=1 Tax=Agromyces flavus TaxID=589382 RepID=A0A1H1ZDI2_9MICO|nr:dihydrofolate reductase family protein [Agromyces flavus]MCP2367042.1 dihydrofolate reductase [Agromyces flavus]GGI46516.1 dihydrofolate reductase [Agromyces flavus]SDT31713.1 Dihydrofolate reductase [Agromyces flavus]
MGRLIVEQIVSADGYAADVDGGIDFFAVPPEPGGDRGAGDGGIDREQLAWLEGVDAILLGANTYRMFAGYWPAADPRTEPVAEPIARLPKHVVSNSLARAPWGDGEIEVLRGDAAASVTGLKERFDAIVLWGSLQLADALFAAGLVDELRLRILPVLIGAGRSFTPAGLGTRAVELDHAVTHPTGHVSLHYRLR